MPFTRDEIIGMAKNHLTGEGVVIEGMTDEQVVQLAGLTLPPASVDKAPTMAEDLAQRGAASFVDAIKDGMAKAQAERDEAMKYADLSQAKAKEMVEQFLAWSREQPLIKRYCAEGKGTVESLAIGDAMGAFIISVAQAFAANERNPIQVIVGANSMSEIFYRAGMKTLAELQNKAGQ